MRIKILIAVFTMVFFMSCDKNADTQTLTDPNINYRFYQPKTTDLVVSRNAYHNKLQGFWLGQCIANWTGLVTEMDKIGNIGEIKTGRFYTRDDWGKPDQPSIWAAGVPSDLSPTIDFVFEDVNGVWGADDDTDIEYMYQHLLYENKTSILSPEQIRDGWLKHIKSEEENFLWVSNQRAFDLMKEGILPPQTGNPELNPEYEMIDAQLTTELFGFFTPGRPDMARTMAELPIQTTARDNAEWIAQYYVTMYALATTWNEDETLKDYLFWMADEASKVLPIDSYASKMYAYVREKYNAGLSWEEARDAVYERYQVNQEDGYRITSKELYCNGCFAAGINFAASVISLLYGQGDIVQTIMLGTLMGWDSDNPTATWGGLLGFMIGKEEVEKAFGRQFSEKFNIHRTRQNFPNSGIDNFPAMADKGIFIVDRVVQDLLGGGVDLKKDVWYIPYTETQTP